MSQAVPPGFFTLGISKERYDLPHRPIGVPVILLVRRVICRALSILRETGFNLSGATEDQVTAALRAVIENNLRQTGSVAGFNRRHYDPVERQSQVANFDGSKLAKTPDFASSSAISKKNPAGRSRSTMLFSSNASP